MLPRKDSRCLYLSKVSISNYTSFLSGLPTARITISAKMNMPPQHAGRGWRDVGRVLMHNQEVLNLDSPVPIHKNTVPHPSPTCCFKSTKNVDDPYGAGQSWEGTLLSPIILIMGKLLKPTF